MEFNLKDMQRYLTLLEPDHSILIRGMHGIGKSAVVHDFAYGTNIINVYVKKILAKLKKKNLRFIDIRLGQLEIGDLLGLPYIKDGKTHYATPELIAPAFTEPCVLFFDELNRGSKDVLQAVFQIILDRKFHSRDLHPDTFVFSAMNNDMDIYNTIEIDPAMVNRFSVIDFKPTASEWLKLNEKMHFVPKEIHEIIEAHKDMLFPSKMDPGILKDPHPTPRSWTKFGKFFVNNKTEDLPFLRDVCATFVGKPASEVFKVTYQALAGGGTFTRKAKMSKNATAATNIYRAIYKCNVKQAKELLKNEDQSVKEEVAQIFAAKFKKKTSASTNLKKIIETMIEVLPAENSMVVINNLNAKVEARLKVKSDIIDNFIDDNTNS